MSIACDFCMKLAERHEDVIFVEAHSKLVHICEECIVDATNAVAATKQKPGEGNVTRQYQPIRLRDRLWATVSGILALAVIGGLLVASCAACTSTTNGCPPFPFAYEPHP